MNNKNDRQHNSINRNNAYYNQNNNQKNMENKKFVINNNDKLYSNKSELKIPDLQILDVNSINCRYVNLRDDLINYSNRGNIKIPYLNIKNYINVNVKTFQFNDLILSNNNKINKIITPDFKIIQPTFIQLKTLQFNDFIINNRTNISNDVTANLNTIRIKPISIFSYVNFNSNIYLEIKKSINTNIAGTLDSSSSNNDNFYDDLKLPWDKNNNPFKMLTNNANKFLIIIVNNKYSEFIAINYRDIYRIYNGGFPGIERVENINELETTLQQTGEHKLIIVKNARKSEHLEKIIDNAPYQQTGCIILGTDDVGKFRLYDSNVTIIDEGIFKIIEKYEDKLINVVSGLSCNSFNNIEFSDFAQNFQKAIINFDEKIENYAKTNYLEKRLRKEVYQYIIRNRDLLINTNSDTGKNATYIHAGMKGFICVYKSNNTNNEIKLESKNQSDVYIKNNNIEEYYEAETFFGREDTLALISSKVKKYKECSGKLIFLMRNIDIIRYFYEFKELLNAYKNNQKFLEIDICGFDFKNNTIESIREIANYLNK